MPVHLFTCVVAPDFLKFPFKFIVLHILFPFFDDANIMLFFWIAIKKVIFFQKKCNFFQNYQNLAGLERKNLRNSGESRRKNNKNANELQLSKQQRSSRSVRPPHRGHFRPLPVVNCLHLSCIFALWNNSTKRGTTMARVVNCLHLSCIFALWNNVPLHIVTIVVVVNCLHLSCIFALWNNRWARWLTTSWLWIACIYLVSLLFETTPSRQNRHADELWIACIYLVSLLFETTASDRSWRHTELWIACIYLVSLLFETTICYFQKQNK